MKYLLLATVVVFLIAQVMGAVPYPAPLGMSKCTVYLRTDNEHQGKDLTCCEGCLVSEFGCLSDHQMSEDYNESLENYLMRTDKRACIRRGGGCDGKPNDCCANSTCRCNLWGTNCRCERAGLFQQWGK